VGADAHIWRARLLAEMCRWLDVSMGAAYVVKMTVDPGDMQPGMPIYVGLGENESWTQYLADGDISEDPATPKIMERLGTDFTCARQELVDDATWYASNHFKKIYEANHWDQTLYSQVVISPPGLIAGIGLARAIGKPAFSPEDVAVVRFVHQELARLWRRPEPLPVDSLPARQREVLNGIRRGETRKQIAESMGISDHTVHSYEKASFEKASVTSRGTLLARLAKQMRPVLLPILFVAARITATAGGGWECRPKASGFGADVCMRCADELIPATAFTPRIARATAFDR
jgi:DNA-binding CsgD family transcriptional regulator